MTDDPVWSTERPGMTRDQRIRSVLSAVLDRLELEALTAELDLRTA